MFFLFSGGSVGPMIFGAVIDGVGMRWSFRIGGFISIATCALFALLHHFIPPYTLEIEAEAEVEFKDVKQDIQPDQESTVVHNGEERDKGKLCVKIEQ